LLLLSGDFVFYSFPLDSVLFTLFVFLTLFQGRLIKLLGLLSFKDKDYVTAVEILGKYLKLNSELSEYWYYFSIANKKLGRFSEAISASEKVAAKQPNNTNNLVNLSDLYRLQREYVRAKEIAIKILDVDPQNENAKKILKEIENKI
ncbi:tetratricopeptide repeat protein, partial [Leptospira alexanderi]|uniref:tetratricopeptide repeat protein n=1 Tax=Leptospira alexanderi TaxID=100053 RepID=UPI0032046B01